MNYQKDVSNFMILGEQKIASDLNLLVQQYNQGVVYPTELQSQGNCLDSK